MSSESLDLNEYVEIKAITINKKLKGKTNEKKPLLNLVAIQSNNKNVSGITNIDTPIINIIDDIFKTSFTSQPHEQ